MYEYKIEVISFTNSPSFELVSPPLVPPRNFKSTPKAEKHILKLLVPNRANLSEYDTKTWSHDPVLTNLIRRQSPTLESLSPLPTSLKELTTFKLFLIQKYCNRCSCRSKSPRFFCLEVETREYNATRIVDLGIV